jgi:DNA-binding NarL/FixJ family response regulator
MSGNLPPTHMNAAALYFSTIAAAAALVASQTEEPIPYHTSALSGQAWVDELLEGHPDRIKNELGMRKEVFRSLLVALCQAGYGDSRYVTLEEQLAIFLYMSVTGLSIRHVGERFQRSNETVSKYVYPISAYLSDLPNQIK